MTNIITNMLQPFAKFTSLLSGHEFTTLSCVVPAIMDMNIHLEEVRPCICQCSVMCLISIIGSRAVRFTLSYLIVLL